MTGEPIAETGSRSTAVLLFSLLAIAALGIAGSGAELAIERHWQSLEQMLAWLALAVAAVGLFAILGRGRRGGLWLARLCAVVAIAFAAVGVWRHVNANYQTAPLDFRYETRWNGMSETERLWAVLSGAVGPAPILASGILATIGIALGAATIGIPVDRPEDIEAE